MINAKENEIELGTYIVHHFFFYQSKLETAIKKKKNRTERTPQPKLVPM